MKTKKKPRIDTYESIYPVKLVVANEAVSIKKIRNLYCYCDGVELPDDNMESTPGVVYRATRKSDNVAVLLVRIGKEDENIKDKQDRLINIISIIGHEAGHVVLDTYIRIQEQCCTESQEPFCYYLQWVIKCICTTVLKN